MLVDSGDVAQEFHAVRHDDLRGLAGRRCSMIGDEVGNREIGFMPNGRDDGNSVRLHRVLSDCSAIAVSRATPVAAFTGTGATTRNGCTGYTYPERHADKRGRSDSRRGAIDYCSLVTINVTIFDAAVGEIICRHLARECSQHRSKKHMGLGG